MAWLASLGLRIRHTALFLCFLILLIIGIGHCPVFAQVEVRLSKDLTPQGILKAIVKAHHKNDNYLYVADVSRSLWDEYAETGKIRLSDLEEPELLDLLLLSHLKIGDLEGAAGLLYRQLELTHRNGVSYYKLALLYRSREMLLPAFYLLEEAARQPLGETVRKAVSEALQSFTPFDEKNLRRADELITFAYEYEPLRQDLSDDPLKAIEKYGFRLQGKALKSVLLHDFTPPSIHSTSPEVPLASATSNPFLKELLTRVEAKQEATVLRDIGGELYNHQQSLEARDKWQVALEKSRFAFDLRGEAMTHGLLGVVLHNLHETGSALDHLIQAMELFQKLEDGERFLANLVNFEKVFQTFGSLENSLAYIPRLITLVQGKLKGDVLLAKDAQYHFERAVRWTEQGDLERAAEEYRRTILVDAEEKRAYINLATLFFSRGFGQDRRVEMNLANILLISALKIDPLYEEAIKRQQVFLSYLRGWNEPKFSANPEAMAHFKQAQELFRQHAFKEAIKEYGLAIQVDPKFQKAYLYLGDCYYNLKEFDKAVPYFEQAVHLNPQDDQARRFLLDAYTRLDRDSLKLSDVPQTGHLGSMSRALRKEITNRPKDPQPLYKLGAVYLAREMLLPARYLFRQTIRYAGEDSDLVIIALRGIAHATGGDPNDEDRFKQVLLYALEDETFRALLKRNPDAALKQYQFPLAFELVDLLWSVDFDLLSRIFRGLPTQLPLNLEAGASEQAQEHYSAAKSSYTQRDYDAVLTEVRQAITAAPRQGTSYMLAGMTYLQLEKGYLAKAYLQEASLLGVTTPDLSILLGTAQILIGDLEAGLEEYERAIKAGSNFLDAQDLQQWRERMESGRRTYAKTIPQVKASKASKALSTPTDTESATPQQGEADVSLWEGQIQQIEQFIIQGEELEARGENLEALYRFNEAWWHSEALGYREGMERASQKAESIRSSKRMNESAQGFVERIPSLQNIARAQGRDEKMRLLRVVPLERRRAIDRLFELPIFFFTKERNFDEALLYAELQLENAKLIPEGPPPNGYAVKKHYVAAAHFSLGNLFTQKGEYLRALERLETAEKLFLKAEAERKQLGLPISEYEQFFIGQDPLTFVYDNIAEVYRELGEFERARVAEFLAEERAFTYDSDHAKVRTYSSFADLYRDKGDYNKALHYYNRALRLVSRSHSLSQAIEKPYLFNKLGEIHSRIGLYRMAMAYLKQALEINKRKDISVGVAGHGRPPINFVHNYRNIATVYESMGEAKKALENYHHALRYALKTQQDNPKGRFDADQTIDPSATWPLLERLATLLRKQASSQDDTAVKRVILEQAFDRYRQGIEIIESTRSKLKTKKKHIDEPIIGFMQSKIGLFQQMIKLLEEMDALAPDQRYAHQALYYGERSKSQALIELLHERNLQGTQRIATVDTRTLLERLAAENLLVIEYYFTDNAVYIWSLGGKDHKFVMTTLKQNGINVTPEELEKRVLGLLSVLSNRSHPLNDVRAQARVLYDILFPSSIRATLEPEQAFIIVPHGILHMLPFQALRDDTGYLKESWDISYSPSASLLLYALDRGRHYSGIENRLLAVLNPGGDPKLESTRQEEELPLFFPSPPSRYYDASERPGFSQRTDATRTALLHDIENYQFIHLFTHGQFNAMQPLDSYLVLSDGRLTAGDIYDEIETRHDFQLKARLITLAACETGSGKILLGDEVLGLPRAFLYAGAASLVSSLWRAEAGFTERLMVRLYEKLAKGRPKAVALKEAMAETVAAKERYAHPFYWAPFVLTGDPR